MASPLISLKWTAKVKLSQKIQDPLSIYVLKFLEDYFLLGVTTQTQRLRYFSFLTWAWKKITEEKMEWTKLLDMEKIITLAAAIHHTNDAEPKGIRNKKDAIDFLKGRSLVDVDKFRNFGRNNKDGYGDYYYRGPCQNLGLWRVYEKGVVFSQVGQHVAKLFGKAVSGHDSLFVGKKYAKRELKRLFNCCFCPEKIPPDEKEAWRKIFFGFVKFSPQADVLFDEEIFDSFVRKELEPVQDIEINADVVQDAYLQKGLEGTLTTVSDENLKKMLKRTIVRRHTLFLILKIVSEAEPSSAPSWNLDQVIRDAIYYKQVQTQNGKIKDIDFQNLEKIRSLWEVFVHNLYYISFLEFMFEILLNILKKRPFGMTISQVMSSIKTEELVKELQTSGLSITSLSEGLSQFEKDVQGILNNEKTSLKSKLNERQLLIKLMNYEKDEEALAALLLLVILLKQRYETFSSYQLQVIKEGETRLEQLSPPLIYSTLTKSDPLNFISNLFELIRNRHRIVSAIKYIQDGTKSWLLTEEDGRAFYYGEDLWRARCYREAKWHNVVELLIDMGLLDKKVKTLTLTKEGKKWLEKIF